MLTVPQINAFFSSHLQMPIWAFLCKTAPRPASSSIYELADVYREELDFPIPDSPYVGYLAEREIVPLAPVALGRQTDNEQHELGYRADDEMSEFSKPSAVDYGTDATGATVQEERCGATERSDCNQSNLSPFSYYYYADPDFEPQPAVRRMSEAVLKTLLDLVEDSPLTRTETWMQCKEWCYHVAQAKNSDPPFEDKTNKAECIKDQLDYAPDFSVFRMLHDQPVEMVDKMNAVSAWQSTVNSTRFGSLPQPPASLVSYLARRRSSTASIAQSQRRDSFSASSRVEIDKVIPVECAAANDELPAILDVEEPRSEHIAAAVPFTDPLPTAIHKPYSPRHDSDMTQPLSKEPALRARLQHDEYTDGIMPPGYHVAEASRLLKSLDEFPVPDLKQVLDRRAGMSNAHGDIVSLREYTPQRIRRMISILTAPSTSIKHLKTFWESQK